MAITQEDINEYLYGVRVAFVDYGFKLARYEQLGKTGVDVADIRIGFRLLQYFIRIVIDYFDEGSQWETINFFTKDEIRDVMQHINNICGTNYMLDLV